MQDLSQECNYLDTQIDKTVFIDTLTSVFEDQLNSFNDKSFATAYNEIKLKNKYVIGRDLLAQAEILRDKNRQILLKQITYFEDQIFKLQKYGFKCFNRKSFQKLFDNPQEFRCLDEIIQQRIMKNQQVSLQKLLDFLRSIRKQFEQNNRIVIPSKINLQQQKLIFKDHILKPIEKLYGIAEQYIVDPMARHQIDEAHQQLIKQQQQINSNLKQFKENLQQHRQKYQELSNCYLKKCLSSQQHQQVIIKLEQKINKQISHNNEHLKRLKEENQKIKEENDLIEQQKQNILIKLLKRQKEYENRSQIIRAQNQRIEKYEQWIRNEKQSLEKDHKIVVQRIQNQNQKLKEQNHNTISRLIEQNNKLKAEIDQIKTANNKQVQDLQKQIQELQFQKHFGDSEIKNLRFSNYRASKYYQRQSQLFQSQIKVEVNNVVESRKQEVDQSKVITQKVFEKKINKEIKCNKKQVRPKRIKNKMKFHTQIHNLVKYTFVVLVFSFIIYCAYLYS